ncbi:MAG: bleomycin resistance protein [Bacteroidota bacterium]|jgi:catechol 2,3-dioxygenase-like lactoylglutathione lyase family enzyme
MLTAIHPKLPMRDKRATRDYYLNQLGFQVVGRDDFEGYLMVALDQIEIHFFEFRALDPAQNYGQVYIRTSGIDLFYDQLLKKGVAIHPNGHLASKPWGQREFSLLDPDHNLLTFGEALFHP